MDNPHYVFGETLPVAGKTFEVAPGVLWLRMPLPFALDHVNLWLIADSAGDWTAVDSGLNSAAIRHAWEEVLKTHTLRRQIITHFHPDHLGLAAWLGERSGAQVMMTLSEYATAQLIYHQVDSFSLSAMNALFRRHGLDEAHLAALTARGNAYKQGLSGLPAEFVRLHDGDEVRIGDKIWRVIVGFGHAPEHASLYCAQLKLLISGDMLLPRISTNVSAFAASPDFDALGGFLASLDRLTALPADTLVLPAHGLPFTGIAARVAALRTHHAERCEALRVACAAAPQTAAGLIQVLFGREFADAHQTMFAIGETIAHLRYLEVRRILRRLEADDAQRTIRFTAAPALN